MRSYSSVVSFALALAAGCLLAAAASGFGHRFQLWGYATGFKILIGAVIGAGIGVVLALVGMYLTWRSGPQWGLYGSVAALVLGLMVIVPPLSWALAAKRLPLIHDITTDTDNPPAFAAILPRRANAPNRAEYGGPEVAALQREAYPDVKPLRLQVSPPRAFDAALETARSIGWTIVAGDAASGRIEASDRTFWFGFIDDVVIRVTATPDGGSRIDVRSVSRVGKSDIGTNARRIRTFLRELSERAGSAGTE